MLTRPLGALFLLLSAGAASAQCAGENLIEAMEADRRAALAEAVAAHPYAEGNLWRAEKDGQTIHVQGTVHIPDPRLDPIVERLRPILAGADLLILEATTEMQADMQRLMAENPEVAFLTEGPTLIDLLGEEDWAVLARDLEARGVPPFVAAKFRPWLLGMTLALPNCAFQMLAAGEKGLDARLEDLAAKAGTPVATLDDMEAVLELLSGGTLEEELDMLRVTLHIDQDQTAVMTTTIDSYFAGRHRELWEFSRVLADEAGYDAEAFDATEATLLDGRNRDWEAKLPGVIGANDALIAVGAAHLSGETGLLRALERMGFTLTRL